MPVKIRRMLVLPAWRERIRYTRAGPVALGQPELQSTLNTTNQYYFYPHKAVRRTLEMFKFWFRHGRLPARLSERLGADRCVIASRAEELVVFRKLKQMWPKARLWEFRFSAAMREQARYYAVRRYLSRSELPGEATIQAIERGMVDSLTIPERVAPPLGPPITVTDAGNTSAGLVWSNTSVSGRPW